MPTQFFADDIQQGRSRLSWPPCFHSLWVCEHWMYKPSGANWRSAGTMARRVSSRWKSCGGRVRVRAATAKWTSSATFTSRRTNHCRRRRLNWYDSSRWAAMRFSRSGGTAITVGFFPSTICGGWLPLDLSARIRRKRFGWHSSTKPRNQAENKQARLCSPDFECAVQWGLNAYGVNSSAMRFSNS
jgi:hypothetical protein